MTPKSITYFQTKDFANCIGMLQKQGGGFQRAASQMWELIGKIDNKQPDPFEGYKTTNFGESRIDHCVKYDLQGRCRLITVCHRNYCILLFVGNHDETDKWLKKNDGRKFIVDGNNKLTDITRRSSTIRIWDDTNRQEKEVRGPSKLIERLEDGVLDDILNELPFGISSRLYTIDIFGSDDEILDICGDVTDKAIADLLLDVLTHLSQGKPEEAKKVIQYYRGELNDISGDMPPFESKDIQEIPTDSPEWVELYKHFAQTANYKDWMLFLHPDQRQLVDRDFNGPAKLLGVSGSGKTCIVVKRAVRLAEKYANEKVLILTLNRSLSKLISDLVTSAAPKRLVDSIIEVKPFFEVCQNLIYELEPGSEKFYSDITWKSEEHIDAIWQEFYRCDLNNFDAEVMIPIHDSLIAQDIDSENYIRDEFDWIRSAIAHKDRDKYLEIERKGRSIPLQKHQRKMLLDGLHAWEKKMKDVGIIDGLGLVAALQPYLSKIKAKYRCILVDESQDFGTSELEIVRKLAETGENDIFLCGDVAQQVSSKYQKLSEANLDLPSKRSLRINKNYRNSKEILSAANKVLTTHFNESLLENEDFEYLEPELADFSGSMPLILEASSLQSEISHALEYTKTELIHNPSWKACIAIAGFSLYEIDKFAKKLKLPVLNGSTSIEKDNCYLSTLAETKGFEFDLVVILNTSAGVIPNTKYPELEQAKDLAQLYVAMTRAKNQLILSFSEASSTLLSETIEVFLHEKWESYSESSPSEMPVPAKLAEFDENTYIPDNLAKMDGRQFLYTEHAIGLSPNLIQALRDKVGKSNVKEHRLTLYVDIGYTYKNILEDGAARIKFGPKASKELKNLGNSLGLLDLHNNRIA